MPRGKLWQAHEDAALRELLKDEVPGDDMSGWDLIAAAGGRGCGLDVGIAVGIAVGIDVGIAVGLDVGLDDGIDVGLDDSIAVGLEVGVDEDESRHIGAEPQSRRRRTSDSEGEREGLA